MSGSIREDALGGNHSTQRVEITVRHEFPAPTITVPHRAQVECPSCGVILQTVKRDGEWFLHHHKMLEAARAEIKQCVLAGNDYRVVFPTVNLVPVERIPEEA